MAEPSPEKKPRGTARVAFIAHLNTITAALAQGHTALAVYQRHQAKLGSAISYPQFVRYVRHLREDGVVAPPFGRSAVVAKGPTASPKPLPAPVEGSANTRHEPARPRTFVYDGNPRQDDKARLIGPSTHPPKD